MNKKIWQFNVMIFYQIIFITLHITLQCCPCNIHVIYIVCVDIDTMKSLYSVKEGVVITLLY